VVSKVAQALNADRKAVNGARVLILGVAYKADIDDLRESPALDIMKHLAAQGAELRYHDPFVPSFVFEERAYESIPLTEATVAESDVVVITTAHGSLDYEMILRNSARIVDTRNALKGQGGERVLRI
jgi:UDP-N-acetyl-D-mannosaminuronate dehydrogenase